MDQPLPPPPPSRPDWQTFPTATAARPVRPGVLTGAAVILIALGVLAVLGGLAIAAGGNDQRLGDMELRGIATAVGIISSALGGLEVLAGALIIRLSPTGRVLGIALAILGLVGAIASVSRGFGVVGLGLHGFVLYALFAHRAAFETPARG